jgi:RNA recognition motif-containing protein
MISARIMTNKETGKSKGFGFVSYDECESANRAISGMNGVMIQNKRLKVELKKESGGNPYSDDMNMDSMHSNNYRPY